MSEKICLWCGNQYKDAVDLVGKKTNFQAIRRILMINEPKIKEKIESIFSRNTSLHEYVDEDAAIDEIYQLFLPALKALDDFAVYDNHTAIVVLGQLNGD